jgi:hypothetical protein
MHLGLLIYKGYGNGGNKSQESGADFKSGILTNNGISIEKLYISSELLLLKCYGK